MALADYRLCDVCGGKAFYDANLNYEYGTDSFREKPYRIGGEEQYDDAKMLEQHGYRLDYLGDWAVICNDCATKYRTKIVPIKTLEEIRFLQEGEDRELYYPGGA